MTDGQLPAFVDVFLRVRRVFALRAASDELAHIQGQYFRVLRRFSLEQISAGADAWIERGTRFPKPAEWVRSIPRQFVDAAQLPVLLEPDASDFRRAERLHFEDEPCACFVCTQAGVTHRMLRYVPDANPDGRDMRVVLEGRIVVRGHWAHGEELRQWYEARDRHSALDMRVKHLVPKSFPAPPKKHTRAEFEAIMAAERRAAAMPKVAIEATTDIAELLS